MNNVTPISRAKSFVAPTQDRYVDIHQLAHHFSLSKSAIKNYTRGYYHRAGKKIPYPQGKLPHIKTPGGHLRFNLVLCEEWFAGKRDPLDSLGS